MGGLATRPAPVPGENEGRTGPGVERAPGMERTPQAPALTPQAGPQASTLRGTAGEAVATELTLDQQRQLRETLEELKNRIKAAKKDIERAYKRKRAYLEGARMKWTEDLFVKILQCPVDELAKEWEADIKAKGKMDPKTAEAFELRRTEAVKIAEQYLEKMTAETGWITPERLAEMAQGAARKAGLYARLLQEAAREGGAVEGGAGDLVEAFKWAIGMSGPSGSLTEGREKALRVLPLAIAREFPRGENGLMPCVWNILAFMTGPDRKEVAVSYLKGKSEKEIDTFLEAGNEMGVFGPLEMEEIREANPVTKGKKYDDKTKERYATAYKLMHDFHAEAQKLTRTYYGSTNKANEMLTLKNVGLVFAEFAAWATIATNMLVSGFKNGEFHLPGPAQVSQWAKNHNILGAAAVATTVRLVRKKERLGQTFASEEERETLANRAAIAALRDKRQEALWPRWDGFFRTGGFAGAQAFSDYTRGMIAIYGEDLPEDRFNGGGFLDYLNLQINKKKQGKEPDRDIDYEAAVRDFEGLKTADILSYGTLFNNLNKINKSPNGQNAGAIYEGLVEKAEKA